MSTLSNMIQPPATSGLFQNEANPVLPGLTGNNSAEQFDHLMTRALSTPLTPGNSGGDKSQTDKNQATGQNFIPEKTDTDSLIKNAGTFNYLTLRTPATAAGDEKLIVHTTGATAAKTPTTAADDLVSPGAIPVTFGTPNKPAAANGQSHHESDHHLATQNAPTLPGNKNIPASGYLSRGKVDATPSLPVASSLKMGTTGANTTPVNSLASAINHSPLDGKIAATVPQTKNAAGKLNASDTSAALSPAMVKNPANSQQPALIKTDADTTVVHSKDSKVTAQISGTDPGNAGNPPDVAKSPIVQPPVNDVTANVINITAQILAPVVPVSGLSVKTAPPSPASGKAPSTSPVLSVADTSTPEAKSSSPVVPLSQPMPETNSKTEKVEKIGSDNVKKDSTYSGVAVYAKNNSNNSTDGKSAALISSVGPVASGAKEENTKEATGDAKISDPAVKMTDVTNVSPPTGLPAPGAGDAKTSGPMPSLANGTSTAQQDELMNSGGKTTKTTDLTGKILPGSVSVVARGNDLPIRADQFSANGASGLSAQNNPSTTTATNTVSGAETVENFTTDDARSLTLERTHDLVAVHAMNVGSTGIDGSLQVVIKPGAGTQLSLELRQHADGVEAQAALQHGDFKHLSQHWPELQQRLEQRGIRLAPLTDDGSFAGSGGNGTFNQKQTQTGETGETTAQTVQTAAVTGTLTAPTARVKAPSGWETWA